MQEGEGGGGQDPSKMALLTGVFGLSQRWADKFRQLYMKQILYASSTLPLGKVLMPDMPSRSLSLCQSS